VEIAKCDVRCANCHRRVTAERGSWWRQAVYEQSRAEQVAASQARLECVFSARPA
jgi:ferredoxin